MACSRTTAVSPARGLGAPGTVTTTKPDPALASATRTVQGSKRKDSMDHFVSKKTRPSPSSSNSSSSNSHKMPSKSAFDAAEKLVHDMSTMEE